MKKILLIALVTGAGVALAGALGLRRMLAGLEAQADQDSQADDGE